MVAGPNGSGKTTLIRALRAAQDISLPTLYINADDLRDERRLDARAAQRLAESLRLEAIAAGRGFMYETVMSHPSKIAELQTAVRAGYAITAVFVATEDPEINIERVALRVADGGHDVPRDRIRARHRRSLALAPSAIGFAAHAYIYDNTSWGGESAQQLQAVLVQTRLSAATARLVAWVRELIDTVNTRAAELEDIYSSAEERAALTIPNLVDGVTDGPIAVAGRHFVLQMDQASSKTIIHDRALLSRAPLRRRHYRIEYAQGVSKVTRRAGAPIRAVKPTAK